MRAPADRVSSVLRSPQRIRSFSLDDWDALIRQARRAELLARLHGVLRAHDLMAAVPDAARWHLQTDSLLADSRRREARRQLRQLRALIAPGCPLVALAGTAYAVADLPPAGGHPLHAIDLLLPPAALADAESALRRAGWQPVPLSPYERRYCRRWRHEPAARRDLRPAAVLNLQHALVADTARYRPDPALLWRSVEAAADDLLVLGREDRILHAATLLLHDDALQGGLRELSDLDLLLRHHGEEAGFWAQLLARAAQLGLRRPLFYALRYAARVLDTPVPQAAQAELAAAAPAAAKLAAMDACFLRALAPAHPTCTDTMTSLARRAVYLRAHWRRRPAHHLVPHLFRKAFVRLDHHDPKPA